MGTSIYNDIAERRDTSPMRRRDHGSTLIEIMISITLMGIVVAAVLSAVQVSIRSSSIAFTGAEVETVLLNAGDRINRAPQRCQYEQYVDAAAAAQEWGPETTTVVVEILVANTGAASDWQPQLCDTSVGPFDVQRLTISATDPGGRITRTLTVVKSDVN
jgi:type II secretory pathway pseudopilin PulG